MPNPSVELTATSRSVCQKVPVTSITPSLWLLMHPSFRRSGLELAEVSFQVAVAHLFR